MKNRISSLLRTITPPIASFRACFNVPVLAVSAALSWSLAADADTVVYNTAGTFNWVCPPGVTSIKVECWGGGGAGGGSFVSSAGSANAGGGGGGGGAYAALNSVPVTPGNTYVITIPPAATCPTSGFTNGQTFDGSNVTFTGDASVTVTANGGKGGGCSVVTGSTAISGAAGLGGDAGSSLDATWKGGNAVFWSAGNGGGGGGGAGDLAAGGSPSASNGTFGAGGTGSDADHTGGNGGASRNGAGNGNAAASPGGGGGGAKSTSSSKGSRPGGTGGLGRIILTYTIPANFKVDNSDNLNLASSWSLGVAPFNSPAIWNNAVTGANTTSLGADLTFSTLQILNPGGPVTINAGNTLNLGLGTIDLDLSNATQDLTLNCDLALGAANVWDVTDGRTLTLGGAVSGAADVTKQGAGTAILSGTSTYTGTTTIDQGTLAFTTTNPSLTGGLTFGASAGSTNFGSLDLSSASASFGGALTVRTNTSSVNNITIGASQSLSFGTGMTVGISPAADGRTTRLTAAGGGSLSVAGASNNVAIGLANTNQDNAQNSTTVDLTGLASFSADVNEFRVGFGSKNSARLLGSNTANSITANTLSVGNSSGQNAGSSISLVLGDGTNVINANTIQVGLSKASASIAFASSAGSLTIRGKDGGTTAANLTLGAHNTTATGVGVTGTLDLRGHSADVIAGTVTLGVSNHTSTGGSTGRIYLDTGSFTANTLNLATKGNTGTGTATGLFEVSGGSFTLNSGTLGSQTGSGGANGTLNVLGGNVTVNSGGSFTLASRAEGSIGSANGTLNILAGTFTSNADIVDDGGTSTITLNGGTLDMAGKNIGGATPIDRLNLQSGTLQNVGEINAGAGWTKTSPGTLVLAGANTYTGAATVNAGTLSITGTLNAASTLAVGGGTLSFANAAPQAVAGLTVNAGSSVVTNTNAGATNALNLGAITRNPGGVVNFANASASDRVIQTSTANTNGILGPWAYVGTDLAMNDGSGNIVAFTAYTDVTRLAPGTIADGPATNVRLIEGAGSPGNVILGATTTTVNTLIQSASGGTSAATLDLSSVILRAGALMMEPTAGALTVGTAAGSGTLTAATSGGELILINNNTGNLMTINSVIADNTSESSLSVGGSGTVVLTAANTYSGTTSIAGATLQLGDGASGNDGTIANSLSVVNHGSLVYNQFGSSSYGGVISGTGTLTKSGPGTRILTGANSYTGNTTISGGVLDVSTDGAQLYSGASAVSAVVTVNSGGVLVVRNFGQGATTGAGSSSLGNLANSGGQVVLNGGTLRFNNETGSRGRVLTVDAGGGTLDVVNGSSYIMSAASIQFVGSNNVLTLTGDLTSTGTIQSVIGGTDVSVVKDGAAKWTLSRANTYQGTTTVNSGTLALGANNVIPDSSAVSIGAATLDAATFADTLGTLDPTAAATINFGTGAALAFADSSAIDWTGGTLTLTGTFVSGSSLRFGTSDTALTNDQLALISATGFENFDLDSNGFLIATQAGYSLWAGTNAGGQAADLDFDNDGVDNGVEYFMNAAAGFTSNPQLNGSNTITWPNGGNIPASAYGTQFVVQTSPNLQSWTDVLAGDPNLSNTAGSLTYTLTGTAPRFVRLVVTPN